MKKLLVIGASGMLGGRVCDIARGSYSIYRTYNTHKLDGKDSHYLQTTDRNSIFKLMDEIKPAYVIDTHALNNVDYCELHPEEAWSVNVEGVRNVAEASSKVGAKYVCFSTDYVFDGKKDEYVETDRPSPLNYYGRTKWTAELVLEGLGIDHIVLRTAVLYGRGGLGKVPFVLWLAERLRNNEQTKVMADQYNNPTFADNLVDTLLSLLESDAEGLFHAAGSDCISRYEFALKVADKFGLRRNSIVPVKTSELKQVAARAEKIKMNSYKVQKVSGIKMFGVEEGLDRLKLQMTE